VTNRAAVAAGGETVRQNPATAAGHAGVSAHTIDLMSDEDLKAELERLKTENEQLKTRASRAGGIKVSEKGGVSVYGLGRFPVTLYKEQWIKLLGMADEIKTFIKENESKLKAKE
jgi:hypothetical protein